MAAEKYLGFRAINGSGRYYIGGLRLSEGTAIQLFPKTEANGTPLAAHYAGDGVVRMATDENGTGYVRRYDKDEGHLLGEWMPDSDSWENADDAYFHDDGTCFLTREGPGTSSRSVQRIAPDGSSVWQSPSLDPSPAKTIYAPALDTIYVYDPDFYQSFDLARLDGTDGSIVWENTVSEEFRDVAVDASGNLWTARPSGIKRVDPDFVTTTVVSGSGNGFYGIVLDDTHIYTCYDDGGGPQVRKYLHDGTEITDEQWPVALTDPARDFAFDGEGGLVFIEGLTDGPDTQLHAYTLTGAFRWTHARFDSIDGAVHVAPFDADNVLVSTHRGRAYLAAMSDGAVTGFYGERNPVDGDEHVVQYSDGEIRIFYQDKGTPEMLICYDLGGNLLWHKEGLDFLTEAISGHPMDDNSVVAVYSDGSGNDRIAKYDRDTGAEIWDVATDQDVGDLVTVSYDGGVWSRGVDPVGGRRSLEHYAAADGAFTGRWVPPSDRNDLPSSACPGPNGSMYATVQDDTGNDSHLYRFLSDGTVDWEVQTVRDNANNYWTPGEVTSDPDSDEVYLVHDDYFYDRNNIKLYTVDGTNVYSRTHSFTNNYFDDDRWADNGGGRYLWLGRQGAFVEFDENGDEVTTYSITTYGNDHVQPQYTYALLIEPAASVSFINIADGDYRWNGAIELRMSASHQAPATSIESVEVFIDGVSAGLATYDASADEYYLTYEFQPDTTPDVEAVVTPDDGLGGSASATLNVIPHGTASTYVEQTNFTGPVADTRDDPDAPEDTWVTQDPDLEVGTLHFAFPVPNEALDES